MSEGKRISHEPVSEQHSPSEGDPEERAFVEDAFGQAAEMIERVDAKPSKTRRGKILRNALLGMLFLVVGDVITKTEASHEEHAVNCSAFLDSRDRTACRRFNQQMEREYRRRDRVLEWRQRRVPPVYVVPEFRAEVAHRLSEGEKNLLTERAQQDAHIDFSRGILQKNPSPPKGYEHHPEAAKLYQLIYAQTTAELHYRKSQNPLRAPSAPPPQGQRHDDGPTFMRK